MVIEILHGSKYDEDKTVRLTQTDTLEIRATRIKLDVLCYLNTDQIPNERTISRKIKDDNNRVWTITHVLNCFGAEMSLISGPQLVFPESNTLLNMYSTNFVENKLIFVLCRDNRKYWHTWMS